MLQVTSEHPVFSSSVAHAVFRHNFHAVQAGEIYRSAELSPEEMVDTIKMFEIKSVIDLRAGKPEEGADGRAEPEVVQAAGAKYFHVPLLGSRMPRRAELRRLIRAFDKAETPVLVHCTSGTHRSGVAAAVWLLIHGKVSPEEAAAQLSAKYGFFRMEREIKSLVRNKLTIDHLIWKYLEAYQRNGVDFRSWASKYYKPIIPPGL